MKKTYYIPRRFNIARTPAGRLLDRRMGDRLRLENILILSTILGVVVLIAIQYLLWAGLSARITADPGGAVAVIFWVGQIAAVAGFLVVMLGGFSPAYTLRVGAGRLEISDGKTTQNVPWSEVEFLSIVESDLYQKHYRKFRQTKMIGVISAREVALLQLKNGPMFIALSEVDLPEFELAVRRMTGAPVTLATTASITV